MRMSEKCRNNNNFDIPLTSRRTNGCKNLSRKAIFLSVVTNTRACMHACMHARLGKTYKKRILTTTSREIVLLL